jgi:glycogen debranching enzyme
VLPERAVTGTAGLDASRRALRDRAAADLDRLRTRDGWLLAGLPRYRRLFGRDACISAWQLLAREPAVTAASLRALAARQGRRVDDRREEEPGKIPHEIPVARADLLVTFLRKRGRWGFPYAGSVDATLWWTMLLGAVDDRALVDELWPAAVAAFEWVAAFHGPVTYERRNPHGLEHQGWRDCDLGALRITPPVALVEVQGYAVAALRAFARLAAVRGDDARAAQARRQADRLRTLIHERFAWPAERSYVLALDGHGRRVEVVSSNPGHLLFAGVLEPSDARALADRLAEADLTTPFGLRCHSADAPAFDPTSYHRGSVWPHDNWIVARGLDAAGRPAQAAALRRGVLDACLELGAVPECYGVVDGRPVPVRRAQPVQAWSAAAVLDFLAAEDGATRA